MKLHRQESIHAFLPGIMPLFEIAARVPSASWRVAQLEECGRKVLSAAPAAFGPSLVGWRNPNSPDTR
jgi:hypothetical protein